MIPAVARTLTGALRANLLLATCALVLAAPAAAGAQGGSRVAALDFELQARRLQGLRTQAATLLVEGGRAGSLAVEVLAAPAAAAGEGSTVTLLIEVEGPTLLSGLEGEETRTLEIYAYALSPQGVVHDFLTQYLRLPLDELAERIYAGGLEFVGSLTLPPGAYSLRVLVLDPADGRFGLRTFPVTVPAAGGAGPLLLAPLLAEPADAWVLARQDVSPLKPPSPGAAPTPGAVPAGGRRLVAPEEAVAPLRVGPEATLPSAFPVLDSGSRVEVHLLAQGLEDGAALAAHLEPETGDGARAVAVPVQVTARLATPLPGVERLSGHFTLPALATAAFRLTFTGGGASSPPLRALVLAENPTGVPLAWGQLRGVAAAMEQTAGGGGPLELPRQRKKRANALVRAARERYLAALGSIAAGASRGEILDSIAGLESELFAVDPAAALPALAEAELAVAAELAAIEPEALLPLVAYHVALYPRYRELRQFALATHARTLSRALVDRYLAGPPRESARYLACGALTWTAREMLDAGLRTSAGEALERAREIEPHDEGALLLAAALYEKNADYAQASQVLEELVAANPKSAEGRLRLAVNLRRTGREEAAMQTLKRLVSEANPPWTLTVAYAELARAQLAAGRTEEAVTLLRQGLDRLPGTHRLRIQLAFALDRQRRFREAREVLAELEAVSGDGGLSPRHRYQNWPEDGVAEARESLLSAAAARLPLLASALDRRAREEEEEATSGKKGKKARKRDREKKGGGG